MLSAITLMQFMQGDTRYSALPLGMLSMMGTDFTKQKPCVLIYSQGPCTDRFDCVWTAKETRQTVGLMGDTVQVNRKEYCEDRRMAEMSDAERRQREERNRHPPHEAASERPSLSTHGLQLAADIQPAADTDTSRNPFEGKATIDAQLAPVKSDLNIKDPTPEDEPDDRFNDELDRRTQGRLDPVAASEIFDPAALTTGQKAGNPARLPAAGASMELAPRRQGDGGGGGSADGGSVGGGGSDAEPGESVDAGRKAQRGWGSRHLGLLLDGPLDHEEAQECQTASGLCGPARLQRDAPPRERTEETLTDPKDMAGVRSGPVTGDDVGGGPPTGIATPIRARHPRWNDPETVWAARRYVPPPEPLIRAPRGAAGTVLPVRAPRLPGTAESTKQNEEAMLAADNGLARLTGQDRSSKASAGGLSPVQHRVPPPRQTVSKEAAPEYVSGPSGSVLPRLEFKPLVRLREALPQEQKLHGPWLALAANGTAAAADFSAVAEPSDAELIRWLATGE